jgi:hypothetical protein
MLGRRPRIEHPGGIERQRQFIVLPFGEELSRPVEIWIELRETAER